MESERSREPLRRITVRISPSSAALLDKAARLSDRTRSEIVREAVERHVEDLDDIAVARERLRNPDDPVLDWDRVRGELFHRV